MRRTVSKSETADCEGTDFVVSDMDVVSDEVTVTLGLVVSLEASFCGERPAGRCLSRRM